MAQYRIFRLRYRTARSAPADNSRRTAAELPNRTAVTSAVRPDSVLRSVRACQSNSTRTALSDPISAAYISGVTFSHPPKERRRSIPPFAFSRKRLSLGLNFRDSTIRRNVSPWVCARVVSPELLPTTSDAFAWAHSATINRQQNPPSRIRNLAYPLPTQPRPTRPNLAKHARRHWTSLVKSKSVAKPR